jgi:hypothetical protein
LVRLVRADLPLIAPTFPPDLFAAFWLRAELSVT